MFCAGIRNEAVCKAELRINLDRYIVDVTLDRQCLGMGCCSAAVAHDAIYPLIGCLGVRRDVLRDHVSAALMDGRWAAIDAADDAMRAMRALVLKLDRLRVDSELALAQRQYREALARGNEEEARAISMREMELIRTKLGLANQSKGMTT